MEIYLNTITDDVCLAVHLEQCASTDGTYITPYDENRAIELDNLIIKNEGTIEGVNEGAIEGVTWTITGTTDSKLYAILNSVKNRVVQDPIVKKQVGDLFGKPVDVLDFDVHQFLNQEIRIPGTDISAMITIYEKDLKEYILYSDTQHPIKYVDFPNGVTTFSFSKIAEGGDLKSPLLNKFSGLVEEPKIDSSVFIERGIVNVFEAFTKLKKVKSLNEMTKYGFGYYKINKQGFNF